MKNEAIVVLGGAIKKDGRKWRTTNFSDIDNFSIIADRVRVVAASYLYHNVPEQLIIASGGLCKSKKEGDEPPLSEVIKEELIELGVPSENIIRESNSHNTFQQLLELVIIIQENNLSQITIITNRYHLPRLHAFIKYCDELIELNKMFGTSLLELKSAEEIAIEYEPGVWKNTIEIAYKTNIMLERIKLEEKGVEEIKKRIYKLE